MKFRNPFLFFVLLIFVVLNIIDIVTAAFILPGEANPLYIFFGNIYPIILLKLGLMGGVIFLYRYNKYNSNFTYFTFVLILVLGILTVGLAVAANFYGIAHPDALEASSMIPDDVKLVEYSKFVGLIYFLPMAFSLLAFFFYDRSLKYVKIDKNALTPKWFRKGDKNG